MKSKVIKKVKKLPKRKDRSMRDNELLKLSIKELKELRLKVDQAIVTRQVEQRNELKEKFRTMAEAAGFNLNDVLGGGRGGKGRSVAAKFANPANAQETWSGRGRQPNWLTAKLKAGAKLDDFRL